MEYSFMIYIDLNIKSIQILGFPFLKDDPKFVCITIICFENLIKMHETKLSLICWNKKLLDVS